jgi:hypothetical protein
MLFSDFDFSKMIEASVILTDDCSWELLIFACWHFLHSHSVIMFMKRLMCQQSLSDLQKLMHHLMQLSFSIIQKLDLNCLKSEDDSFII